MFPAVQIFLGIFPCAARRGKFLRTGLPLPRFSRLILRAMLQHARGCVVVSPGDYWYHRTLYCTVYAKIPSFFHGRRFNPPPPIFRMWGIAGTLARASASTSGGVRRPQIGKLFLYVASSTPSFPRKCNRCRQNPSFSGKDFRGVGGWVYILQCLAQQCLARCNPGGAAVKFIP